MFQLSDIIKVVNSLLEDAGFESILFWLKITELVTERGPCRSLGG
jgi:hypothetical protein